MAIIIAQAEIDPVLQFVMIAVMFLSAALPIAFWVWMLNDCLSKELPGSREKRAWTVIIIVLGLFGALAYNVGRRKQRIRELGR